MKKNIALLLILLSTSLFAGSDYGIQLLKEKFFYLEDKDIISDSIAARYDRMMLANKTPLRKYKRNDIDDLLKQIDAHNNKVENNVLEIEKTRSEITEDFKKVSDCLALAGLKLQRSGFEDQIKAIIESTTKSELKSIKYQGLYLLVYNLQDRELNTHSEMKKRGGKLLQPRAVADFIGTDIQSQTTVINKKMIKDYINSSTKGETRLIKDFDDYPQHSLSVLNGGQMKFYYTAQIEISYLTEDSKKGILTSDISQELANRDVQICNLITTDNAGIRKFISDNNILFYNEKDKQMPIEDLVQMFENLKKEFAGSIIKNNQEMKDKENQILKSSQEKITEIKINIEKLSQEIAELEQNLNNVSSRYQVPNDNNVNNKIKKIFNELGRRIAKCNLDISTSNGTRLSLDNKVGLPINEKINTTLGTHVVGKYNTTKEQKAQIFKYKETIQVSDFITEHFNEELNINPIFNVVGVWVFPVVGNNSNFDIVTVFELEFKGNDASKKIVPDTTKKDDKKITETVSGTTETGVKKIEKPDPIVIIPPPKTYEELKEQATKLYKENRYAEAKQILEQIVAMMPDSYSDRYNLALISYVMKDYRQAVKVFGNCVNLAAIESEKGEAYYYIALCYAEEPIKDILKRNEYMQKSIKSGNQKAIDHMKDLKKSINLPK